MRLKAAVAASQNPQFQHIVGLLLLTGARLRELLEARWEHVDATRRSWFIPTSKTGKSRYVPLSTPALAIIETLPRFKNCPWLVPNPDTRLPFVSIKHSWQHAIKEADLPGLRLHDLRHSAASFMVNSGVDLFAVGKVHGSCQLSVHATVFAPRQRHPAEGCRGRGSEASRLLIRALHPHPGITSGCGWDAYFLVSNLVDTGGTRGGRISAQALRGRVSFRPQLGQASI